MAERVIKLGGTSCGITDHGVVTGHLEFFNTMNEYGLRPLMGCELYHGLKSSGFQPRERDQAHLIAVARTDQGLRNLWCLVNATSDAKHFRNVGRVFWEDIEKYHEGITFTSACCLGLVPQGIVNGDYQHANRYLDILGDDFVIEVSSYPADSKFRDQDSDDGFDPRLYNEALVSWAQERGARVVYGDDSHYASPVQAEFHDIYIARQTGQTMDTPIDERKMWHPPNALVIKSEEMVRENLWYLGESMIDEILQNTHDLAEECNAQLPEVRRHLPTFIVGDCPYLNRELASLTPEELFIDLVEQGIVHRYGQDASVEVWQRAFYEVETLINDGIHHYFLMGWDEIQMAKKLGVEIGPGRGSSAGCIVSYALGITDVCPLHYGLIFERFWNSGRAKGFPDIDTDFSRARRHEIIAGLKDRWGADRVSAIGTTGYLKPKATIDKMAQACGISFTEAEELKDIVGNTTKIEILGPDQIGWNPDLEPGKKYYVKTDCGVEIEKWCKTDRDREKRRRYFIQICEACCSRVSQYGIHASGVVISDIPINDELPAYRRGGAEGQPATMFDMESVDSRMFVKLDVLGLRTLDVLEWWRQAMKENHQIDIQWTGLDLQEHPQEMWDMLQEGYTAGIFQVEDGYGKQLCKAMNPSSILDLSALNALNRPGPIQAGIPDQYIARRNGSEPVTYIHPRFEELMRDQLEETYGLFVYQEQIIKYFNILDYNLGESDAIRKIMGKKKPEQMDAVRDGLNEWEGRGYLDMAVRVGIPRDIAQLVWNDLEGFADYCFNRSHTVAYSVISFRTLYAKYYGAAEFYAACIRSLDPSSDGEKRKSLLPQFINECRRQGIDVVPPDIYGSMGYPVARDNKVYFGFRDIAGVKSSGSYLVELRDQIGLDMESAEVFRQAFEAYNAEWAKTKKERIASGELDVKARSPKQLLTSNKIDALENSGAWFNVTGCPVSLTRRQEIEGELLGVVLTDNTVEVLNRHQEEILALDLYSDLLIPFEDKIEVYDLDPADERAYIEYIVPGVVCDVQERRTRKSGESFAIISIEYGSDLAEFIAWPKEWKTHKFLFRMRTPGVFTIQHRRPNDFGEAYVFTRGKIWK